METSSLVAQHHDGLSGGSYLTSQTVGLEELEDKVETTIWVHVESRLCLTVTVQKTHPRMKVTDTYPPR